MEKEIRMKYWIAFTHNRYNLTDPNICAALIWCPGENFLYSSAQNSKKEYYNLKIARLINTSFKEHGPKYYPTRIHHK